MSNRKHDPFRTKRAPLNVAEPSSTEHEAGIGETPSRRRLWVKIVAAVVFAGLLALAIVAEYIARHAEPMLRARILSTLAAQCHSPVELDGLHISVVRGIEVEGTGLRVLYLAGPAQPDAEQVAAQQAGLPAPPMLTVQRFVFHVSLHDLRRMQARVARVQVEGVQLHIPPHSGGVFQPSATVPAKTKLRFGVEVGKIECRDVQLYIETAKPGKDALRFDVHSLDLSDLGGAGPLQYRAELVNPHPRGNVTASGHLGPWQVQDPRSTPIDGQFLFDQADLRSIKGLRGTLHASGSYSGQLGHLAVQATNTVPDFALDVSGRPEPLLAVVQSTVDGSTGDTILNHIDAKLGSSAFTTQGAVVRVHMPDSSEGHDIQLAVQMDNGRMEDLLALGMKTSPPLMRGAVAMQAKLHIPPGRERVAQKIQLAGNLAVQGVTFSSAKLQNDIDGLSLRAQGKPEALKQDGGHPATARSAMAVQFSLGNELMSVPSLQYEVPGAKLAMDGVYSLDGNLFEFKGHVQTAARASEMVTGWKAMLLKPFDSMLSKNGAGVELPIVVTGEHGDYRVGLAMHSADESTAAMAADLQVRRKAAAAPPKTSVQPK